MHTVKLNFLCLNADLLNSMDLSFLGEGSNYILLRKNLDISNESELVKHYAVEFLHYPLKEYVYEILEDTVSVKFDEVCILCRDVNANLSYFSEIIRFAIKKNKLCKIALVDTKNEIRELSASEINSVLNNHVVPLLHTVYASLHSALFFLQFLILLLLFPLSKVMKLCKRKLSKSAPLVCIAKRVHSNQSYVVAKALKELGVKVVSVDLLSHSFGYEKCDISKDISRLNPLIRFFVLDFYFLKFLFSADVFLFENNGESFFVTPLWKNDWFLVSWLQKAELFLLKLFGAKIIFEMRDCSVYSRKDKLVNSVRNICKECSLVRIKGICSNKRYILANQTALKYADFVFCSTPELKETLSKETLWLPNGYIFKSDNPIKEKQDEGKQRIKIIHASTSRAMKGTDVAIAAVAKLKEKYDIDFVLIEKMSNKETHEHIQSADIVIGQLTCGAYGNFEIESLANAKPVICYTLDEFYGEVKLPFINVDGANIEVSVYEACEKLILDKDLRDEYAKRSYAYAKKMHNYRETGLKVKNVIDNLLKDRN